MKKSIVVFAVLGLLIAGVALAGQAKAEPEMKFEGNIVMLDEPGHLFVVKGTEQGKETEMTFHVGADSKILLDGEPVVLTELEKGDHVTVTYETKEAKHMVKSVHREKKPT